GEREAEPDAAAPVEPGEAEGAFGRFPVGGGSRPGKDRLPAFELGGEARYLAQSDDPNGLFDPSQSLLGCLEPLLGLGDAFQRPLPVPQNAPAPLLDRALGRFPLDESPLRPELGGAVDIEFDADPCV